MLKIRFMLYCLLIVIVIVKVFFFDSSKDPEGIIHPNGSSSGQGSGQRLNVCLNENEIGQNVARKMPIKRPSLRHVRIFLRIFFFNFCLDVRKRLTKYAICNHVPIRLAREKPIIMISSINIAMRTIFKWPNFVPCH